MPKLEKGVRINHGRYVELRLFRNRRSICHEYFGPAKPWAIERANARSLELQKLLYLGKYGDQIKPERWLVSAVLDCYWEHHARHKPSADSYARYIHYFKEAWPSKSWDELTNADIEDYQENRFEEGIGGTTVRKELGMLRHVFNIVPKWIELRKLPPIKIPLQRNPVSLVKLASVRYDSLVLSLQEFERVLAVAPANRRLIYETEIQTLLRLKDLKNLTADNIVWPVRCLKGIQAKTRRPFSIPLSDRLAEVFSKSQGKLLDFTNFWHGWQADRAEAGLNDVPFRALRRTGATWMYHKTGDLKAVSDILGHSTIQMTEKYIGVESQHKQIAVDAVAKMLNFTANSVEQLA